MNALGCMLCGVAGDPWLFWLLVVVFALAFAGSVVLCVWSVRHGDFRDDRARWLAVEAEDAADGR